jgi:hypothetical protein
MGTVFLVMDGHLESVCQQGSWPREQPCAYVGPKCKEWGGEQSPVIVSKLIPLKKTQ